MIPIYGIIKNNKFTCENSNTYSYKKNSYQICYDGNIYNSGIIKQELLLKGYYFETNLEEEVVLKAFIDCGIDAYNKFAGHFAFAIWDESKEEIIFMRDYYSIKSFYYKINTNDEIEFSNKLSTLLTLNENIIKSEQFVNTYLKKFSLKDRKILENINEMPAIMIYSNNSIKKIEEINCIECGYIFDEVAQIVLANLDNICAIKLEEKNNEIDIIMEYILDKLGKEKIVIESEYSREKLNWFLANMELPFFNIEEYKLNYMLARTEKICLVNTEKKNIKRFYNINFFENVFNLNFVFPNFARKSILKLEEVYNPTLEKNIKLIEYIDKEYVIQKFRKIFEQTKIPMNELDLNQVNYYMMIYLIRLNNWVEKYNIKII